MLCGIFEPIVPILDRLTSAGWDAYAVGGCVRDALRGVVPHDFDVTTNALPNDICALFSDCTVIPTGIEHGTVTVLWDGAPIEITTYRTDGVYTDSRHPDSVTFTTSLCEDLSRRDFTVNALAADRDGKLQDFFGGRADLQAGILRAVGEPRRRFCEDALRILRLWRFAAILGFSMERETSSAAQALAPRLQKVAWERIFSEFKRGLCGAHIATLIAHPLTAAVFAEIAPALCSALRADRLLDVQTALGAIDAAQEHVFALRFAALCHYANISAREAQAMLQSLRSDRAVQELVAALLDALSEPLPQDRLACKRALARHGVLFFDLLRLRAALFGEKTDGITAQARELLQSGACLSLDRLAVSGNDLIAAGIPKGKQIGQTLRALLDAVIEERLPNEKEALLRFVI